MLLTCLLIVLIYAAQCLLGCLWHLHSSARLPELPTALAMVGLADASLSAHDQGQAQGPTGHPGASDSGVQGWGGSSSSSSSADGDGSADAGDGNVDGLFETGSAAGAAPTHSDDRGRCCVICQAWSSEALFFLGGGGWTRQVGRWSSEIGGRGRGKNVLHRGRFFFRVEVGDRVPFKKGGRRVRRL